MEKAHSLSTGVVALVSSKMLPKQSIHRMTRQDIINLLNEEDDQMVSRLNSVGFGFQEFVVKKKYFLKNDKIDFEIVASILEIGFRVCNDRRTNKTGRILMFLKIMATLEEFLYKDVFLVIEKCLDHKPVINLANLVANFCVILKRLLYFKLGNSQQIIDSVLPNLQNVLNEMRIAKVRGMKDLLEESEKLKIAVDRYNQSELEFEEDDDRAGVFRSLSIVPKDTDVINVLLPNIPCNIVDRPYNCVNHYLSVHFNLMREDMLRSFRETVSICLNPSEAGKLGIKLYNQVTAEFPPEYSPEGISYKIHVTTSKPVDIAKKDILMPGNMVCLTPNRFQSVIFAVVAGDPKSSQNITSKFSAKIRLEATSDNVLKKDAKYLMVETNAYFECYRHVLDALRGFDDRTFPLDDFLVYLNFDYPEPEYLVCSSNKYCFHEKCTRKDKFDDHTESVSNNQEISLQSNAICNEQPLDKTDDATDVCNCKQFKPLDFAQWPTREELELDEQQYEAFKLALTRKVAIIQGPPGTGKTYIGVKIVKALLQNVPLTPIIICCLTNHALDQFLEKILQFTSNVIRVGSQSKSQILEPHTLDNLMITQKLYARDENVEKFDPVCTKSFCHLSRYAPNVLKSKTSDYDPERGAICQLCDELNNHYRTLKEVKEKYLDETALNLIIDSKKKEQLRAGSSSHSKALGTSVFEWLCKSRSDNLYEECTRRFQRFASMPDNVDKQETNLNLWSLELSTRYELFFTWRKRCLRIIQNDIDYVLERYKEKKDGYRRKPDMLKVELLTSAHVIGVTTTGAAKFKSMLGFTKPAILVIEEAAEVLEAHVISALLPTVQQMILIGDHKQLRPLPANHDLSENYKLNISMFERLFNNKAPSATLVSQHRMKPQIAELLIQEELYTDLKSYENVYKYEEICGVNTSVFFFNHTYPESEMSSGTSSYNDNEARLVVSLAKYLCVDSYTPEQITILATYTAQVHCIQTYLEEETDLGIFVTSVDNYQGEENDIIIISFVRNNQSGIIGFLKESNRVCVALSRARKGMFCFGNFTLYASKNTLWKNIVSKLEAQNMIGDKLPLTCTRHKTNIQVQTSEGILEFIRQGCGEKCNFQLACSHLCTRTCHSDDLEHNRYRCPFPCEKFIDENKKCPRLCYERCKKSKKEKIYLKCGHRARLRKDGSVIEDCEQEVTITLVHHDMVHEDTVLCSTDMSKHKCRKLMSIKLPCGHKKNVYCYRLNDKNHVCFEPKMVLSPCGHSVSIPCCNDPEDHELLSHCNKSCDTLLSCGHTCIGQCNWCLTVGIHPFCTEKCEEVLNCGHICSGYCGNPCPPCEKTCLLSCSHKTKCINPCSRPCVECQKSCERGCIHTGKCFRKCFERCSVKACTKPCTEFLDCGHACIGLCGDPCPYLCRKCNEPDLPGNPKIDRYVQLEDDDCSHVIEYDALNKHIETRIKSSMWPDCPVCHHPITKSLRFKDQLQTAKESVLQQGDFADDIEYINYELNMMGGMDSVVPAEFMEVCKEVRRILHKVKPTYGTLHVLKDSVIALSNLIPIREKLNEMEWTDQTRSLHSRFETLLLWISNHLTEASYQQMGELETAVKELKSSLNIN